MCFFRTQTPFKRTCAPVLGLSNFIHSQILRINFGHRKGFFRVQIQDNKDGDQFKWRAFEGGYVHSCAGFGVSHPFKFFKHLLRGQDEIKQLQACSFCQYSPDFGHTFRYAAGGGAISFIKEPWVSDSWKFQVKPTSILGSIKVTWNEYKYRKMQLWKKKIQKITILRNRDCILNLWLCVIIIIFIDYRGYGAILWT